MNYVKHHNIFGVEAKEIPCIVGTGAPDNAVDKTGLLYMDQSTGEIYKRTANGWELLNSGNTTYTLTKSGSQIILTGSDGTTYSVTDTVGESGGGTTININLENGSGTGSLQQTNVQKELVDILSGSVQPVATANGAVALGYATKASGKASLATGTEAQASEHRAQSLGADTLAAGYGSFATGKETKAYGFGSHTEGNATITGASNHIYTGTTRPTSDTDRIGAYAHAEGSSTIAYGEASHSEGQNTKATGYAAHAEGTADGTVGDVVEASGDGAHAEGYASKAYGNYSHAEGYKGIARGNSSHSEGSQTNAIGEAAHAEGALTVSRGKYAHSQGYDTHARGNYSSTLGLGTITVNAHETAVGKYNVPSVGAGRKYLGNWQPGVSYKVKDCVNFGLDEYYVCKTEHNSGDTLDEIYWIKFTGNTASPNLFTVGNGSDESNRSNAFVVGADGHSKFANSASTTGYMSTSDLTANATPQFRNIIIVDEVPTDLSLLAIGDLIYITE